MFYFLIFMEGDIQYIGIYPNLPEKPIYCLEFSEDEAQEILKEDELKIICDLGLGGEGARGWTCDLSYEYIKINADYRS